MARISRPQTEKEIEAQEARELQYDFFGIPHDIFDGDEHDDQRDKDYEEAHYLIMVGKQLPEDLKERLLIYKKEKPEC